LIILAELKEAHITEGTIGLGEIPVSICGPVAGIKGPGDAMINGFSDIQAQPGILFYDTHIEYSINR